jgi:hypothetical protein
MNPVISTIYPSFPRKRESRNPRFPAVALDPRFHGGDE